MIRVVEDYLKGYLYLKESDLNWMVICLIYLFEGEIIGMYWMEKEILLVDVVKILMGDIVYFIYYEIWV